MALDDWFRAVDARDRHGLDLLVVGDSWGEGQGASVLGNRWLDLLRDQLRTALVPAWVPGGAGYIPSQRTAAGFPQPWTYTGTTSAMSAFGLGRRSIRVPAGGTATVGFDGDGFDLFFALGGYGAKFTWSIDSGSGGASGVVDESVRTGTTSWNRDGELLAVRGIWPPGPHTLNLEVSAAVASTNLYLGGLMVYDGDERGGKGLRVWDGSHAGFDSAQMLAPQPNWLAMLQRGHIRAAATVIMLGINDYGHKLSTAAAYGDRLGELITLVRRHNQITGSVIVCAMPKRGGVTDPVDPWDDFHQAAVDTAAAHGAHLFDVRAVIGDWVSGSSLWADSVHLNDAGHAALESALAAELLGA